MEDYILVGAIIKAHGLKGEVKLKPLTQFIEERFSKKHVLYVKENDQYIPLTIHSLRRQLELLLVVFEGYTSIEDIESLLKKEIYIAKSNLHKLQEDEVYYRDLMGCQVTTEAGEYLGEVVDLIETGANVVMRVKQEEKEMLIPYVKAFVIDVDCDSKKIIIKPIAGLL